MNPFEDEIASDDEYGCFEEDEEDLGKSRRAEVFAADDRGGGRRRGGESAH